MQKILLLLFINLSIVISCSTYNNTSNKFEPIEDNPDYLSNQTQTTTPSKPKQTKADTTPSQSKKPDTSITPPQSIKTKDKNSDNQSMKLKPPKKLTNAKNTIITFY